LGLLNNRKRKNAAVGALMMREGLLLCHLIPPFPHFSNSQIAIFLIKFAALIRLFCFYLPFVEKYETICKNLRQFCSKKILQNLGTARKWITTFFYIYM
jgi:hypothetical protein